MTLSWLRACRAGCAVTRRLSGLEILEQRLKPRRVVELKTRLISAVQSRVFVANELKDVEIVLDQVESVDGSRPRLVIRIKRRIFRRKVSI